jgi:hypothetical protein
MNSAKSLSGALIVVMLHRSVATFTVQNSFTEKGSDSDSIFLYPLASEDIYAPIYEFVPALDSLKYRIRRTSELRRNTEFSEVYYYFPWRQARRVVLRRSALAAFTIASATIASVSLPRFNRPGSPSSVARVGIPKYLLRSRVRRSAAARWAWAERIVLLGLTMRGSRVIENRVPGSAIPRWIALSSARRTFVEISNSHQRGRAVSCLAWNIRA